MAKAKTAKPSIARKAAKPEAAKPKLHEHFHRDGSLWAKGQTVDDKLHGHWEFYRKDGVIMRSGSFDRREQTGDCTTYDKAGKVYKGTRTK